MTRTTLTVLVPVLGTIPAGIIDSGSGIVSDMRLFYEQQDRSSRGDWPQPTIEVYYEGNRYGMSNIRTFEDRVFQAAGRLVQRYPTIARGVYPRAWFTPVGTFAFNADWSDRRLDITDHATLDLWVQHVHI